MVSTRFFSITLLLGQSLAALDGLNPDESFRPAHSVGTGSFPSFLLNPAIDPLKKRSIPATTAITIVTPTLIDPTTTSSTTSSTSRATVSTVVTTTIYAETVTVTTFVAPSSTTSSTSSTSTPSTTSSSSTTTPTTTTTTHTTSSSTTSSSTSSTSACPTQAYRIMGSGTGDVTIDGKYGSLQSAFGSGYRVQLSANYQNAQAFRLGGPSCNTLFTSDQGLQAMVGGNANLHYVYFFPSVQAASALVNVNWEDLVCQKNADNTLSCTGMQQSIFQVTPGDTLLELGDQNYGEQVVLNLIPVPGSVF